VGLVRALLFRDKLFLVNCDLVRDLAPAEVRQRLMLGVVFSQGLVLSPNMLMDTPGVAEFLRGRMVGKYLREEGLGQVTVRGRGLESDSSLVDYFRDLPDDYLYSGFPVARSARR